MASKEDLVKYMTQRFVTYIETPKELRKQQSQEKVKEPWGYRWFGLIPMSLQMLYDQFRKWLKSI